MNQPLYEISQSLVNLIEQYNSVESDEELLAIEDQLSAVSMDFNDKVESIGKYYLSLDGRQKAISMEVDRLQRMIEREDKVQERLLKYVKMQMELAGKTEVKGSILTARIKKNPASVEIVDESIVPESYKKSKVTISIDKTAIKEAWKNGVGVSGTQINNNNTRLEIK